MSFIAFHTAGLIMNKQFCY